MWIVAVDQFGDAMRVHRSEPEMELVKASVQGGARVEEGFEPLIARTVRVAAELDANVREAVVDGYWHRRMRLGAFVVDRNGDGEVENAQIVGVAIVFPHHLD